MAHDPNDTRLVTPLVLIALIIVGGFLYSAYHGSAPTPEQHAAVPAPAAK